MYFTARNAKSQAANDLLAADRYMEIFNTQFFHDSEQEIYAGLLDVRIVRFRDPDQMAGSRISLRVYADICAFRRVLRMAFPSWHAQPARTTAVDPVSCASSFHRFERRLGNREQRTRCVSQDPLGVTSAKCVEKAGSPVG